MRHGCRKVTVGLLLALPLVNSLCTSPAFQQLFPATEYDMRNAASRTDGYWPFVAKKEVPPIGLTYGEYPLEFFSRVADRAIELVGMERDDAILCDIGSGSGRLVLWAAFSRKWHAVHGVELLPALHAAALEKREQAVALHESGEIPLLTPPAAIHLHAGSFDDGALMRWDEVDVAFAYTTAFEHDEDGVLTNLTDALRRRLREGCVVCTTDYTLGKGFEMVEQIAGENEGVGGTSVAYLHRKLFPGESWTDAVNAKASAVDAEIAEREREIDQLEARADSMRAENEAARAEAERLRAQLVEDVDESDDLRAWASEAGYDL